MAPTPRARPATLIEALPWMERFAGTTMVIKYGGNAMVDDELAAPSPRTSCSCSTSASTPWWCTAAARRSSPCSAGSASSPSSAAGCGSPRPEAMDVVRMVLAGQVGRELVGLINPTAPYAVGHVRRGRRPVPRRPRAARVVDGEEVDLGLVGEVVGVEPGGHPGPDRRRPDPGGRHASPRTLRRASVHNVNADTAAAALAVALQRRATGRAHRRRGPLRRLAGQHSTRSPSSTAASCASCCPRLESGMMPKMEACLRAVEGGADPRARRRRPGAARDAAGDLHRRRHRHHGRPRTG